MSGGEISCSSLLATEVGTDDEKPRRETQISAGHHPAPKQLKPSALVNVFE